MKMIKTVAILLVMASLLGVFTACKGPIADGEAREIAKELIEKEITLTAYVYGDEFKLAKPSEYEEHKDDSSYYYAKVSKESPYTTKQQMVDAIYAIYTDRVAEEIMEFAFNGNSGENGASIIPRFFQGKDDDRLKIDVTSFGIYKLSTVVDLKSLTVKRSTRSMMEVTVNYTAGESDTVREMEASFKKVDGEWKLDTRTWAAGIE